MTPSYDEPGTRTRQAWLRTGLGIAAVTLLVVRGLIVAGLPPIAVAVAVAPGAVLVGAAVARGLRLRPGRSPSMPGRLVTGACACVVLLAATALVSVVAP